MKPVLFNTEMVRAILDGRKCVTRRVIPWDKVNAVLNSPARKNNQDVLDEVFVRNLCDCRYEVGDILYVRENWAITSAIPEIAEDGPVYMADFTEQELRHLKDKHFRWRPSIHMPKELTRLFLHVTDVHAERLQEIDEKGAMAEGIWRVEEWPDTGRFTYDAEYRTGHVWSSARECFGALWDSTVKPAERELYGWKADPWVWAIQYERCEKPGEVLECSK